jgi:myo-inositol-1(or 4)-monophosphatase
MVELAGQCQQLAVGWRWVAGSARNRSPRSAIELAWTAEGRLDACIMLGNKPWDPSAGVLIAREAGARVLDHHGSEHSPQSHSTIAVTPTLEAELMAAIRAALA